MGSIRAVLVDYDGTLTSGGRPQPEVLQAVAEARHDGLLVVLATGRILDELRAEFPDVGEHVDAVVGENGAVLARDGQTELLAPPIGADMIDLLERGGVPARRGEVILATQAVHRPVLSAALTEAGLDHQLVVNRGELMVVPAGVTKATGAARALAELGTSPHNAVAIGDAENDGALLQTCEVGMATADAVPSLRRLADVVLEHPDGLGVVEALRGPVVAGTLRLHPPRWHLLVGHDEQGEPVFVPASQVNVLVRGLSHAGKSHVAGLLAEQLIHLGYSVLVLDPEGDHEQLATMPGVFLTGGSQPLLPADQIVALLRHRAGSVVVDLSGRPHDEIAALYRTLPPLVEASRAATGLPHWILIDEAHEPLRLGSGLTEFFTDHDRGYLLVTYDPARLDPEVLGSIDVELEVGPEPPLLRLRTNAGVECVVRAAPRWTHHVRHWHKYASTSLVPERGFWFRAGPDHPTGVVASSLAELQHELRRCSATSLRHHAGGHDLSRWIAEVFGDRDLAAVIVEAEEAVAASTTPEELEAARHRMMLAVDARLLSSPRAAR